MNDLTKNKYKLVGPFMYLGQSKDRLVVYDSLGLLNMVQPSLKNNTEGPLIRSSRVLQIPKGEAVLTHITINSVMRQETFNKDYELRAEAKRTLIGECLTVNSKFFASPSGIKGGNVDRIEATS